MRRMFRNQTIETFEQMAECGLHGGNWQGDAERGFCSIDDRERYAGYLECVKVPEEEGNVAVNADIERRVAADRELGQLSGITPELVQGAIDGAKQAVLAYDGLSPDAPTVENENGGKQSVVAGRFDLIPPVAAFELAKVMEHGATKYEPRNWMKIDVDSHLNHLLAHVFAYLAGDRQDDHLTHALARAAMAVEIDKVGVEK